jgi:hypothetical protein
MPNRIVREGILTSDRVNALSVGAEVFYRRLLSVVDDYGRFDGRIVMLKVSCFPLRVDVVREADCSRWIAECEKAGLIVLYAVDGKRYLEVQDFRQAVRAKQSKYPPPPDATHMRSRCVAHAPEDEVEDVDESRRREAIKGAAPASPLPPWLPAEAWERWKRHRGRKLTAQARDMQLAKLDELRQQGHSLQAVIDLAIESGWATFYPPKQVNPGRQSREDLVAAVCGISPPRAKVIDITPEVKHVAIGMD